MKRRIFLERKYHRPFRVFGGTILSNYNCTWMHHAELIQAFLKAIGLIHHTIDHRVPSKND